MASQPYESFSKCMPMIGEGTVSVNRQACGPFCIVIQAEPVDGSVDRVGLSITEEDATFFGDSASKCTVLCEKSGVGYESSTKVSYWFSFNRDDRVLKYGKGYIMEATTCMNYEFPEAMSPDPWAKLFDPTTRKRIKIVENCPTVSALHTKMQLKSMDDVEKSVAFTQHPLVNDWPYVVKDSKTATMFDISSDEFILSASLPQTCRELYSNVASADVDLDWPPNVGKYKLSDAIGYSIATKGKLLYNKLKEKQAEGDMAYLRVTLGYNRGSSPGIPYVLELWPAGSKSPIHNHGNSYAVIKVVYGAINIGIYNKTWPGSGDESQPKQLKEFNASKGEVTWLSPNWYQTHQLRNHAIDPLMYCATIQCYKYGQDDELMWPYFDYLQDKHVKEFKPHTDFDFLDMREKVLKEYADSHEKKPQF